MKKYSLKDLLLLSLLPVILSTGCNESGSVKDDQAKGIAESLGLYLPADLEVSLWAESPDLYNPTNMDVDIKGRIWVTEAVNYRNFNNDSTRFFHHPKGDRVMILEDTDGDGKADVSKVFVQDEDLIAPVGIAVIGNKVIVSCSPNLIVYTDEDGDDKPDKKEILLTGFGGRDHDHSLHAVFAGADGNWYFNTGNAGPHIVTDKSGWTLRSGSIYTGGTPYNLSNHGNQKSDDGKVWVGGLALRVNPDGTGLKVLGHNFRNSYEVFPDSYGNLWQNDNDDQVVTCRVTWLMEGGNAGYFSEDGTRYWQADQRPGQDIFAAHWHQDDPGVMPAGDNTGSGSPTGVTVNESDALGKDYLGMLLSADAGRNVIFGYHPEIKKSGYDLGKRINFISSLPNDNAGYVWNDEEENKRKEKWFRPSDVTIGTDGAIYIADWYDPVVGGHQILDTLGYGRIYRIAPKSKKLTAPEIDINTVAGQLEALKSPAVNVRNQGFQKLKLQGETAIPSLLPLLSNDNPYIKARAIWLMAQLGEKGKAEVEKILEEKNELFRATAYRALRQTAKDILPYAIKMSTDPSAFVRREVAVSIRDLPYEETKNILLELAKGYDGEDRWYLETLGSAMEGNASQIYPELLQLFAKDQSPDQWNKKMSGFAWRLHPAEAVNDLALRANDSSLPASDRQMSLTALGFINNKNAAGAMLKIVKTKDEKIASEAAYWLSFRQSNDWNKLLDWSKMDINTEYQRKLAEMLVKKQMMLDEHQPKGEREHQARGLAGDPVGGQLLIGMAAENKIPSSLKSVIEEKIFQNPDATIRAQAGKYFKQPGNDKAYVIPDIAAMTGDATKGKQVFASYCSTCHKVGTVGSTIGPNLSSIGQKFGKTELLDAIINPSAAIVFGYEPWLINKKDGESVFGFLLSENKENIIINDISGHKHIIALKDITSKQKQDKSLMPAPADLGLKEQDLADVVSYLSNNKQ